METIKAVTTRFSCRGYTKQVPSKQTITEIIEAGCWAPSGSNYQPWEIAVVTGQKLEELKKMIASKRVVGASTQQGSDMPATYNQRRAKQIEEVTKFFGGTEAYQAHMKVRGTKGGDFYGAPVMILVYQDKALPGRYLFDVGLLIQTMMLVATDRGLGSIILGATSHNGEDMAQVVGLGADKKVVYGIALGYPDMTAPENKYPRMREDIADLTRWFGF